MHLVVAALRLRVGPEANDIYQIEGLSASGAFVAGLENLQFTDLQFTIWGGIPGSIVPVCE
jgi:hypothetical protein